ncbi:hypothetical protein SAMN05443144_10135 [Fodinibius roseus]|uniref:Uncharacterized protein n=2 Tax=Fodinibius roseus TaxID=1194090 RepID=A0A1M4SH22_9BACT|nr:hypothetical protein SAMN05443144_10135 [Fodinibius roseus]
MIKVSIKVGSFYFFVFLLFISCSIEDQERGRVTHPKEKFLPSAKPFVGITDKNPDFSQNEAAEYLHRLKSAKRAIKIGVEIGGREHLFTNDLLNSSYPSVAIYHYD